MHLTEDILERLLKDQLPQDERNEAIRHLLGRCPECLKLARTVGGRFGMAYISGRFRKVRQRKEEFTQYDPLFDKLGGLYAELREKLVNERLQAAGQWASLQKHSHSRRLALIAADPSLLTWGLYERLLDTAREITPVNPERGLATAELAIAVAQALDTNVYGKAHVADFQAAALAVRGNCKRVAEDFEGARADLEIALEQLKRGTNDALERANILSLQGSWSKDLGYYGDAEKLYHKAINLYRRAGEEHMVGRTLVKLASAIGYVEPERAVQILDEASGYVSIIAEPLIELCMRHALALFLNDAGRTQEAIGVLEDSRSLYKQFPQRVFQLRLRWLEGRINRNLGNLRGAEETFDRVALDFLDKGLAQEYLLCSIDLAEVIYAQGDRTRTVQICTSLLRALESWHMHAEGQAVMLLFIDALQEDAIQTAAFLKLSRYMRQAWYLPQERDTIH